MTVIEKDNILKDDKIEDIFDLQYLKKFACPKNQHMKEWYLECVECKSKDRCKAGKQALFILNNETAPEKEKQKDIPPMDPNEKKKRDTVEDIFRQADPVKVLLETSGNVKPQTIYARVNMWRKNYPDLEAKYHMIEKVRFLWTKPYDSMRVPDILKMMYPEKKEEEAPLKKQDPLSEDISVEEFLAATESDEPVTPLTTSNSVSLNMNSKPIFVRKQPKTNEPDRMDELLAKLEKDRADYKNRIAELDKQIEAIHVVQNLLG